MRSRREHARSGRDGEVPGQGRDAGPDHLLPDTMVASGASMTICARRSREGLRAQMGKPRSTWRIQLLPRHRIREEAEDLSQQARWIEPELRSNLMDDALPARPPCFPQIPTSRRLRTPRRRRRDSVCSRQPGWNRKRQVVYRLHPKDANRLPAHLEYVGVWGNWADLRRGPVQCFARTSSRHVQRDREYERCGAPQPTFTGTARSSKPRTAPTTCS